MNESILRIERHRLAMLTCGYQRRLIALKVMTIDDGSGEIPEDGLDYDE